MRLIAILWALWGTARETFHLILLACKMRWLEIELGDFPSMGAEATTTCAGGARLTHAKASLSCHPARNLGPQLTRCSVLWTLINLCHGGLPLRERLFVARQPPLALADYSSSDHTTLAELLSPQSGVRFSTQGHQSPNIYLQFNINVTWKILNNNKHLVCIKNLPKYYHFCVKNCVHKRV